MRSGGFMRKSQTGLAANGEPAGSGAPVFRPGPIPNPFRVDYALPALDPADGKCGGCGSPLAASAVDCQVCGTPKVVPTDLGDGRPSTPTSSVTVSRACIHCSAWTWSYAAFCHSCGRPPTVADPSPGPARPPNLVD